MNRIFTRKSQDIRYDKRDERIISVAGIGQGVGTSTVATALAFCFAQNGEIVTYVEGINPENCDNLIYNKVAMDKRFTSRKLVDLYDLVSRNKEIKGKYNYEENIYWIIATPSNLEEKISLNSVERYRLLLHGKGTKIIDIKHNSGWEELLKESDVIIAVIDPLPSKMITNVDRYKMIKRLELRGTKVYWIVNKMNKGVNRHQVKEYIKGSNITWIEAIPNEKIYSDEYFCRFSWKNEELNSQIMYIFTEISQYL